MDGAEGGTGAAPPEFSNSLGMPLVEALALVDRALVGVGLRDHIKVPLPLPQLHVQRRLLVQRHVRAEARARRGT